MKLEEVETLISMGESEQLEFKKSTAQLKAVGETLCSFLNGCGGTVLIGVSDSLKIVGQTVTDLTKRELANMLKHFEPAANIEIKYVNLGTARQKVIILTAYPDRHAVPYTFNGRSYERKESSTHRMSQSRYQQLLFSRHVNPVAWESQPAIDVTVHDLDHDEILRTLKEGIKKQRIDSLADTGDVVEILKQLELIRSGQLTNAAVVLFSKKIVGDYFQCVLRMAKFRGTEKGNFVDSKHIFGNAFQLLREAEAFINRHTSIRSRFEKGKLARTDEPEYPFEAIREALINSITHRDYASAGGSVTIAIYDDRIEITNIGVLPMELSIEDLQKRHISIPRNKYISNVFFRRGYVEAFGIGIQLMQRSCREGGLADPEFSQQGGAFSVCFRSVATLGETQLTSLQQEILQLLDEREKLSLRELLNNVSIKASERNLRHELYKLKEADLVDLLGHGRGAKWKRLNKNKTNK